MNIAIVEKGVFLSSVVIAELTGKRHDHVMRDIREMFDEGGVPKNGETPESYENTYIHPQNKQEYPCYILPKREVMILVSGYSITLRAAIIDRLEALESKNNRIPTLRESLETSLRLLTENEKLVKENEGLKEIEAVYNSVIDSSGLHSMSEGAKILGTGEIRLFKLLRERGILMSNREDYNTPYQKYVDSQYFEVKLRENTINGVHRSYRKTYITNKGIDYIKKLMEV